MATELFIFMILLTTVVTLIFLLIVCYRYLGILEKISETLNKVDAELIAIQWITSELSDLIDVIDDFIQVNQLKNSKDKSESPNFWQGNNEGVIVNEDI